jgi:hypothetical protein
LLGVRKELSNSFDITELSKKKKERKENHPDFVMHKISTNNYNFKSKPK